MQSGGEHNTSPTSVLVKESLYRTRASNMAAMHPMQLLSTSTETNAMDALGFTFYLDFIWLSRHCDLLATI